MQTQGTFIDDLKHQFKYGTMTIRLLFINVAIFLIINLLLVFGRLIGPELNSSIQSFIGTIFVMNTDLNGFIYHPWTLFTSIFAHLDFFHILFNMIFLYFSGKIFEQMFDRKRLLYTYILGGIAGGLLEILAHTLIPTLMERNVQVVGASGSIMAIFVAIAFYQPQMKIMLFGIFPVRLIVIAGLYLLSDFFRLGTDDGIAHFAHLGGAVFGIASIQNIHSSGNVINFFQGITDRILRLFNSKKSPNFKVKKGGRTTKFKTDEEYNMNAKQRQEEINRILDKISKSGYESLTKNEKDFLFNQSKNG